VGVTVRRKVKFWLLLLLGVSIFTPFILFSIIVQLLLSSVTIFGIMYTAPFLAGFVIYCFLLYRFYRGKESKYPIMPPEGRTDIYFPRTDIPRPIHEDTRRYPKFFKTKKKKRYRKAKREEKMRKKK